MINIPKSFKETDPELYDILTNFLENDVNKTLELDKRSSYLGNLATLLGCGGKEEFALLIPNALEGGLDPVEIREVIYQGFAYLGIGRVLDFVNIANEVFRSLDIKLPLEDQKTVDSQTRREKGTDAQVEIFGEGMEDFWKSGTINFWLAANCFGDYYTRKGLDLRERELITLCYLAAQGGCEPQLISHAAGNMKVGNDKEFLTQVVLGNLPYIGYPRTLNAINCINNAAESLK